MSAVEHLTDGAGSPMARVVRREAALLEARHRTALSVTIALIVLTTLWTPVVLDGDNRTAAGWSGLLAFADAWQLGVLALPVLVLAGLGRDADTGTRQARFLAGIDGRTLAVGQLLATVRVWGRVSLWCAVTGFAAGGLDWSVRWVTGEPTEPGLDLGSVAGSSVLAVLSSLVAGTTVWLLVLACRSGRRALAVLVLGVASFLVPLLRLDGGARELLGGHPFALLWSVVDPFPAEALQVDRTPLTYVSAGLAALLLLALARTGARRPR